MYTVEFLRSRRVWFEELLHQPASSATKHAHHMHVPGRMVAKTVLVKAGDLFVLAVLPCTSRIDLERLGALLGVAAPEARLATTDELVELFTDCEPGVAPPFAKLYGLRTVFDVSLLEMGELVFIGNMRHEGLRMRASDYVAIEEPLIGSFAMRIDAARTDATVRPLADRRAG
jgi:Ala-tRNA(Pro) deacylase